MKCPSQFFFVLAFSVTSAIAIADDTPPAPSGEISTPMQAVQHAAERAPEGFAGIFEFKVRATGADAGLIFLNSEQDYRDQRTLTVAVSPAAAASLEVRLGKPPREALIGQTVRVSGIAHRATIWLTANGRRTDKYYYQTHVDVSSADQIELIAPSPTSLANQDVQTGMAMAPGFVIDGRSAVELSTEWWHWAMSAPGAVNPVADTTGEQCGVNQAGKFWFLAGGFGSSKVRRRCHVPTGKYIFFPVVNSVSYPRQPKSGYSCSEAQADATYANAATLDLFATVDGTPVPNLLSHRAATKKCFDIFARAPNAFNATPSATDGFWLMLKPLSKGVHTLSFGGRQTDARSGNNRMVQDIEYELVID